MSRINDADEILRRKEQLFLPRMRTNLFLSEDTIRSETEQGTLWAEDTGDGLFLFRERDGFRIMNFILSGDPVIPAIPERTVTEIPHRAGRPDEKLFLALRDGGFAKLFDRVRLTCQKPEKAGDAAGAETGTSADIPEVLELMAACFDLETGCIPTRSELERDRFWTVRIDGRIAGCLHGSDLSGVSELRHLCVAETCRGRGIASTLVDAYLGELSGRARVWVRDDNVPALCLYGSRGFRPDGTISTVMRYDGTV